MRMGLIYGAGVDVLVRGNSGTYLDTKKSQIREM